MNVAEEADKLGWIEVLQAWQASETDTYRHSLFYRGYWLNPTPRVGAGDYSVKLTPMRGASPTQLSRVEAAVIDRFGREGRGGLLTNVTARELEQELFEGTWG